MTGNASCVTFKNAFDNASNEGFRAWLLGATSRTSFCRVDRVHPECANDFVRRLRARALSHRVTFTFFYIYRKRHGSSTPVDVIAGVDTTTTTPVPESTFLPVVHLPPEVQSVAYESVVIMRPMNHLMVSTAHRQLSMDTIMVSRWLPFNGVSYIRRTYIFFLWIHTYIPDVGSLGS